MTRITGLLSLIALAGVVAAQSGIQTPRTGILVRSSRQAFALERKEDEPAVSKQRRSGPSISPRSSFFGIYRSIQVNTDPSGHNIPGDAANEPSICVDPNNSRHIVIGWRQFDSVTSNFREAGNAYSLDGGATWHNNPVLTKGTFRSDPVLTSSLNGSFYYLSLQESFFDDLFGSLSNGSSWNLLGPATGGDKQWMTLDQTSSVGAGNMYQSWSTAGNNYGGRQFSRSTDGGFTWSSPIDIPEQPIWGSLDVNSAGDMYLCGLGNDGFACVRSTTAKLKSLTPTFDQTTIVDLGGYTVFGAFLNPAGLAGQSWVAVDRSTGPTKGNVYMLSSVGVDDSNPCDVNFARSSNGGMSFDPWTRVNDDPKGKGTFHWFGTIGVAPNGRLDVIWLDNRANPSTPVSALYYSSSTDGGLTWQKSVQVSRPFDSTIAFPNQAKIGDYMTISSDAHGANVAYAATFNGEEDVYFLRIPAAARTAVNADAVSTYQGTYLGGSLADIWNVDGATYNIGSTSMSKLGQVAAVAAGYTLPSPTISALSLNARVSTGAVATGMWWLYNWVSGAYDLQGIAPINSIGSLHFDSQASPANYVSPSGVVRVVFRAITPIRNGRSTPFTLKTDQLQLLFG